LATENAIDLDSEDGDAHLRATLKEGGAEGTVELPDGTSVTFNATSAAGSNPAGLYELALSPDGVLSGTSWGDKRLELQGRQDGGFEGTVTLPNGETLPFKSDPRKPYTTTAGQSRAIILPDGTSRGKRTKTTGDTSGSFRSPIMLD
jgi:hypothetical protein